MSNHETGGHTADQPSKTDQSDRTETRNGGDAPSTAEDPSNRESRSTGPASGGRSTGGNMPTEDKSGKLKELKEHSEATERQATQAHDKAAAEWEEKLKVVL
jgi:hypothetical protein